MARMKTQADTTGKWNLLIEPEVSERYSLEAFFMGVLTNRETRETRERREMVYE